MALVAAPLNSSTFLSPASSPISPKPRLPKPRSLPPYPRVRAFLGLSASCSSPLSNPSSHSGALRFVLEPKPFFSSPLPSSLGPVSRPSSSQQGSATASSDVMGLMLKERSLFLWGTIDDYVADVIISHLILLDAQDHTKDIRLFINSRGGSFCPSLAIYDAVQHVRADVSTIAIGRTNRYASIILGGGTKGKRLAMPNARIMLCQPVGGIYGEVPDVDVQNKDIQSNKDSITRIISSCTGRTFEQVQEDIYKDKFMSPFEAVEYGIIDGVIDRDTIIPLVPVLEKVKPN